MTDYGQDLLFGSFVTPDAGNPGALIAHARTAECAGLDLVAVQDHPYQPRFVDTLTLLGQMVARTQRIRVTGDVMNLAMRPPAVLAKSLATLDLFSGGRVEAGIGAGAFWDAIEAYGGRRLTPGQAVDALTEAIGVMRAIWGANGPDPQTVPGEYYRLAGALPGPMPSHLPEVWVGAYKPRMLALTGSVADGWLPSLHRLTRQQIADAHKRIDDAAAAAGRDPRRVRRLANLGGAASSITAGSPKESVQRWIDDLTVLVLDDGFSAFIVAGDDESSYRVVGEIVAPAVRDAVARARR